MIRPDICYVQISGLILCWRMRNACLGAYELQLLLKINEIWYIGYVDGSCQEEPSRMRRIGYIERNCMKEPSKMKRIGYIEKNCMKEPSRMR